MGWWYIRVLQALRLARVKKLAPKPVILSCKDRIDMDTVRAVVLNRLNVMADYARTVVLPVLRQEKAHSSAKGGFSVRQARRLLVRDRGLMDEQAQGRLRRARHALLTKR